MTALRLAIVMTIVIIHNGQLNTGNNFALSFLTCVRSF